ncbi:MAG: VWA domain-containing protein [Pirellulales bacterium]|nr:VWA domain-containing protein [Pirellulales bacterium]
MFSRKIVFSAAAIVALLATGPAMAAVSVGWVAPPDGSSYLAGTVVNPNGQAGASGTVGGAGLDLALVLDSSGSMSSYGRQQAQKDAAIALVNALPLDTTSVAVIEYDSDANTVRVLTALSSDKALVIAAINSVDASGGTDIRDGINQATAELTGVHHTVGRAQMMVVTSDGGSTQSLADQAADNAIVAGVDAVHSVGISSSHSVSVMQAIVNGVDDIYGTADDHGIYTDASDLTALQGIFDGTGGSLVGVQQVDVTLPNGVVITGIATDGLGNFVLPNWTMVAGANVFSVKAYGTDGSEATADLTLYGTVIPEPATVVIWSLLGAIGLAYGRYRRRRTA